MNDEARLPGVIAFLRSLNLNSKDFALLSIANCQLV
jgi:hypothetical protein